MVILMGVRDGLLETFNDIMDASEKRGRKNRSNWLINDFRQAVMDYGLSDVLG